MKKILIVILFILPTLSLSAKQYGLYWADTIDYNVNDKASDIAVDSDGNIYVTGCSNISGNADYLTIKYDSLGNIQWIDTLDTGNSDKACGIAVDSDGNIYVTGYSIISGNADYLTIKYNSLGNIQWIDTLDTGGHDMALDIAVDTIGNVYVTGYSPIITNYDYLTVKYNSLGIIQWADTLDTGSYDEAMGIAVDAGGNVYVTGFTGFSGTRDYLTVKYNSLGNIQWADTIDNGNNDEPMDIGVDKKGNVYVTGYADIGGWDWFTVKYNPIGNIQWIDTLDTGSSDQAYGIAIDDNGNVYVTGYSRILAGTDFHTVKYDSLGNVLWADTLDTGNNFDQSKSVVSTGENVYITGYFSISSDYNFLTVRYSKNIDVGILSILSSDTVIADSIYTPEVLIRNNSYLDTLDLDITAFIDSGGVNVYGDTQTVNNFPPGDSTSVVFDNWTPPLDSWEPLFLKFSILSPDMNPDNDTISKELYLNDPIPVIDSALASDGTTQEVGIDADDYVILYFSEQTNKPTIDNTNIESVLSLSGGHSWLDGFGTLGGGYWNPDGDQLLVDLNVNVSPPTVSVGDTITPDSATIMDVSGTPCFCPIVLSGSFDPSGIEEEKVPDLTKLNLTSLNTGGILLSYEIAKNNPYKISIYSIDGRLIKEIKGKESGYYKKRIAGLTSGIYLLRLKQEDKVINKKVVLLQ